MAITPRHPELVEGSGKGVVSSAATSLDKIGAENIGYRFANVSKADPPDTIFAVTWNYADGVDFFRKQPPAAWWDFSGMFEGKPRGYVIVLKCGDAQYFMQSPVGHPELYGILPPREPKFLPP